MSTIRLLFRRSALAGLASAALLSGAFATSARADDRDADSDGPAMVSLSSQSSSFELFGRKVCVTDARQEVCDVHLDHPLLTPLVVETGKAKRWTFHGVTFCAHQDETGAKCDLAWTPPQAALAWRDFPEVRLGDDLPRR